MCSTVKTSPATRTTIIHGVVALYHQTSSQLKTFVTTQGCLDQSSPMAQTIRSFADYLLVTANQFQNNAQTWTNVLPSLPLDQKQAGAGILDVAANLNLGQAASLGWQWLTGQRQTITRADFLQTAKDPALLNQQLNQLATQRAAANPANASTPTSTTAPGQIQTQPLLCNYVDKRTAQMQTNLAQQALGLARGGYAQLVFYLNQQSACIEQQSPFGKGIATYMNNYVENMNMFDNNLKARANYL